MSAGEEYGLSVTLDPLMDLIAGPFDRRALKNLFALYKSWGVNRIDWNYMYRHEEGYYTGYWAYEGALANAQRTYENVGELMPAVAAIAHELDMACFASLKVYDRAFTVPLFRPEAGKHGLRGVIGGGIARATKSLLELQHCRMERNTTALSEGAEKRIVTRIRFESDSEEPHRLTPESLRIEVSPDNDAYRPYAGPVGFQEHRARGRSVVELSGLSLPERYVAFVTPFREDEGRFANTLDGLVRLFDAKGREIPFTYGLESHADRFHNWTTRRRHLGAKMASNVWRNGYVFDASGESTYDGFLKRHRRALDGAPGYLALAKGKARHVVTLSPSYREVQDLWLREIQECLDAGVDGVDIRIDNHARSQEWEAYGFEAPAAQAYRKRWGTDPRRGRYNAARLRAVRAEHFTEFIRRAGRLVRGRERKFHAHILGFLMRRHPGERYMGMKWEWEKWLDERLLDGVTMKGICPWWPEDGKRLFDALTRRAAKANADVWYCANFNVLADRPDWVATFSRLWRESREAGHAGMNLYESAELAQKRTKGRLHLHHPELPGILAELRRQT